MACGLWQKTLNLQLLVLRLTSQLCKPIETSTKVKYGISNRNPFVLRAYVTTSAQTP